MNQWDYTKVWKTEAEFMSWVRGHLRKMWSRYPLKVDYKNSLSYPAPKGYTGRAKQLIDCEVCGTPTAKSSIEVDHIIPCGSLRSMEDVGTFVGNLLCSPDNMRCVCKDCHSVITHAERKGITFEEAKLDKEVIAFGKLPVDAQKGILHRHGYGGDEIKNRQLRLEVYRMIMGLKY